MSDEELLSQWSHLMVMAGIDHTVNDSAISFTADSSVASFTVVLTFANSHVEATVNFEPRCHREFVKTATQFCNACNSQKTGFFSVSERTGDIRYRRTTDLTGLTITQPFVANFHQSIVTTCASVYKPFLQIICGASFEKGQTMLNKTK